MSGSNGVVRVLNDRRRDTALRVLLVDDDEDYRTLVRYLVEQQDRFEVVGEAGDGATGISLAQQLQPDVVLLDLSMPLMDGLQSIQGIRSASPGSRILVCSNFDRSFGQNALDLGADDHVSKGAGWKEIYARITSLLSNSPRAESNDGKEWVSPYILSQFRTAGTS
ncbi:MAG: response regulator transcription factor [Actinomycetota bacterium]|nr:response regulator transcription factor [Actinomycetota bacterium]